MQPYVEKFTFMSSQCDQFGNWRPGDIMVQMQEVGGRQSALLGMGRGPMLERGVIWVLLRNELRLLRSPRVGEVVVAVTWPGAPRRTLFPRYHRFTLEDGTPLAYGTGGWTLADVHTRRMASLPEICAMVPDAGGPAPEIPYPGPVRLLEGPGRQMRRPLLFSDFDLNGHVNNTRAGDWLNDLLGADIIRRRPVTRFLANYNREILPGGPVTLDLRVGEEAFSMTVSRDGDRLLDCGGELGY